MRKFLVTFFFLLSVLLGQTAQAAEVPQLVSETKVVADKAVTPMDYSFFNESGPGKVEMYNIKNLWGAGAQIVFYLQTNTGSEWLMLKFDGGMIEFRLQNRNLPLFSEKVSKITATTPLTVTVQDGKLTVAIGSKSRTVENISAFRGDFTTQSIEGILKAYHFVEQ